MKKQILAPHPPRILLIPVLILLSIGFSIAQCPNLSIRGPRVICGEMPPFVVYSYFVENGGTGTWQVYPLNAGDIVSQVGQHVEVKWYQSTGAVIFTENTCSDTLFLQECCQENLNDDLIIKDFSSRNLEPEDAADLLNASIDQTHRIITINGSSVRKQVFIQGEFDVTRNLASNELEVVFQNCDIYLGPGAVLHGNAFVFFDCTVQGRCGMWQGINVINHGLIQAENSSFSDAEYCINVFDYELNIKLRNCRFTRNFVSIHAPASTIHNAFSYYVVPNQPSVVDSARTSYIENCLFDGLDPITLPPYTAQWGIPVGERSFAGMFLNNFSRPNGSQAPLSDIPVIPFSRNVTGENIFSNLHYGIYAMDSDLDVFNCSFINIQPESSYNPRRGSEGGCAIYSKSGIGASVRFLKVGEENDAVMTLNYQNDFINCRRGIATVNGVNSFINYNSFLHTQQSTTPSGTGIYLKDAELRQISIGNNTFTEENYQPDGAYSSTGIVVSSLMPTYKNMHITNNTFMNEKVGVYLQNSKGRRYSDTGFLVQDNVFVNDKQANELSAYNGIFGIWLNNVSNGMIRYNQFYRPVPLSLAPSNFQTMLYGMNVVGSTNMNIAGNDFTQYGTSVRMVSNCPGTTLKCNNFIANVQGISLALASMSAQGWPGEAWDNKWDGFPTTSSSSYNRADGTVTFPIDWYNQGDPNDVSNDNRFSPEPVNNSIIWAYPNHNSPGCYTNTSYPSGSEGRNYRIARIIEGDMEYVSFPEETKYLDQEFAYQSLSEDSLLRELEIANQEYYDSLQQSEFGHFEESDNHYLEGDLVNALQELGLIIETSAIEYNKVFTREIFLNQKVNGEEEFEPEIGEELHEIAWTNAWEGGSGVFAARHLMEEQVFDLERNLRKKNPVNEKIESGRVFFIYPNPAHDYLTLFYSSEKDVDMTVKIVDMKGLIRLEEKLQSNKLNVASLTEGIYIITLFENDQFHSTARLTILK